MLATIATVALVTIVIIAALGFGMLQVLRLIGLTRAALARELLLDRGQTLTWPSPDVHAAGRSSG